MSFRRYIASTVREGLDRVRRELGDDAVILSNKRLGPGRIEIVAAASDSMQALVEEADRPGSVPRASAPARERPRSSEPDPTESFQDYIRRQTPASAPSASAGRPAATARASAGKPAAPTRARKEAAFAPDGASAARPDVARRAEAGVAMYHEVASAQLDTEDFSPDAEAFEPLPVTSAPARFARVPAQATAAAAAPVASHPVAARQARPPAASARPPAASPQPPARPQSVLQPAAPQAAASPAVFRQRSMLDEETAPGAMVTAPTQPSLLAATPLRPAAPPAPPSAPEPAVTLQAAPAPRPTPAPLQTQALSSPIEAERDDTRVMVELRSLRAALSDRIAALESNIEFNRTRATQEAPAPRNTAGTRVMTRLLMSGFSPELSRRVAAHAPTTGDMVAMDSWLHQVVTGNLRCATAADGLLETQGAIALVGPTGVGKTTTVAKLAARFAVRHGAAQLGLITLDSYRIGAHEQLRSYGRILGVAMHVAQDGATLRELLSSLQGKRLVLIDTCGLSQRDERLEEMLGMLSAARFNMQPIRRILLLNAASHAETLDEVARAWRGSDAAGSILTKLDEAARIGGAVDCLLRYRMMLYGLTNGQRVPEDWHPAGARLIAHVALKPSTSPFTLGNEEAQALAGQMQGGVPA